MRYFIKRIGLRPGRYTGLTDNQHTKITSNFINTKINNIKNTYTLVTIRNLIYTTNGMKLSCITIKEKEFGISLTIVIIE